jgi:hypothetical protein
LIADADFIRSEVYLDLRVKYIQKIEEKMRGIGQSNVAIEPESLATTKIVKDEQGKKLKHFTKTEVQGPLRTDIFTAPSCRRTYARKKKDPSAGSSATTSATATADKYVSFDEGNKKYYLHIVENVKKFDIYDEQMSLVGYLEGSTITLICDTESLQSKTINLRTVTNTDKEYLFGTYILDALQ